MHQCTPARTSTFAPAAATALQPPRTIPGDLRANLAGRLHAPPSRPAARRHLGGLAMRGRSVMSLML